MQGHIWRRPTQSQVQLFGRRKVESSYLDNAKSSPSCGYEIFKCEGTYWNLASLNFTRFMSASSSRSSHVHPTMIYRIRLCVVLWILATSTLRRLFLALTLRRPPIRFDLASSVSFSTSCTFLYVVEPLRQSRQIMDLQSLSAQVFLITMIRIQLFLTTDRGQNSLGIHQEWPSHR